MDVFEALQELKKESAVDTIRQPLAPAEGNNGISAPRKKTLVRELGNRYSSPTRSTTSNSNSNSKRFPSPTLTRAVNPSPQLASKRAVSVERKRPSSPTSKSRPSTPTSTSRPSTPVSDTAAEQQLSSKKIGSRLPEVLWPSTMRSLSVSFQSDSISIPVSKKEKPITHALSDRTLKPSSNVAHKQVETPRKSTPERKRSPVKGRNSTHQSENSRPNDAVKARLIDQHRWPSRAGGGKLSSTVLAKSVDLSDSAGKFLSSSLSNTGLSVRRPSAEGVPDGSGKFPNSLLSNIGLSMRRLSGEGVPDSGGKIPSSSLSNNGLSVRRLSGEGVPDSVGKIPSSSLSNTGLSVRRLSGEGVPDSVGKIPSSLLSSTGISSRRLSAEGVPDSVGRIPSSSLSNTGLSVRRLSAEGVPDSAENIPSSPFSSTGISSRLSAEGVPDSTVKIPCSSLSSTGLSVRRLSAEGVPDSTEKIPSSSLSSTGLSVRRLSAEGVLDSVGKIPNSLHSSTGIPLRRLSAEGVHDSVGRIPNSHSPRSSTGILLRRQSAEGVPGNSQKNSGDHAGQSVFDEDIRAVGLRLKSVDDLFLRESALLKEDALSSSRRASIGALPARSKISPGQRLPSPIKIPIIKSTPSPVRTRPSTPTQARGASPSRIRPSSPTVSSSTTSVLSFTADIKGKKNNQLEDAHQLRLLHNRYLQWRFANAQAEAALYLQKITTEESLYNVLQTNLELWDSVIMKRIDVQRLKLELRLNSVLSEQLVYLEDWASFERDHCTSLDGFIKDLEASTLRLPVTGGAKVDIDSLKAAMSSAVNVAQAMGSSIRSVLSKVEDANSLVSELAAVAGQERSMLNECDAFLASTSAMQVREYSLRTQLIQSDQDIRKTRKPLLWAT